jgi:hypothetical protein
MTRVFGGALADVTADWRDLLQLIAPNWTVHADNNQRVRIVATDFERNAEAFEEFFEALAGRVLSRFR